MGLIKIAKKILKGFDMFGKPIMVTFENHGDNFTTTCGGFISMIL